MMIDGHEHTLRQTVTTATSKPIHIDSPGAFELTQQAPGEAAEGGKEPSEDTQSEST